MCAYLWGCSRVTVFLKLPFFKVRPLPSDTKVGIPVVRRELMSRPLFPFLQKYIPGNPTSVSEYMPGGGSRKAASKLGTRAPMG